MRIIANDAVSTFACDGSTHRGGQSIARAVIVEAFFRVLIASEGEDAFPELLILGGLDQTPVLD